MSVFYYLLSFAELKPTAVGIGIWSLDYDLPTRGRPGTILSIIYAKYNINNMLFNDNHLLFKSVFFIGYLIELWILSIRMKFQKYQHV